MKKEARNPSRAGSHGRKGVLLVSGALMLTGLFGALAIATDVGYFLYLKRRIQAATDAAVMSGVQALRRSECGDPGSSTCKAKVKTYAEKGAERNGFENGVNNITVTVNQPPLSGGYTTNPLVVEVITCQTQSTFFMPIFGTNDATACARAAAGYTGQSDGCIWAMNRTEEKTLYVHSTEATLDADCEAVVNSTNPAGLYVSSGACLRTEGLYSSGEDYADKQAVCDNLAYSSDPIDPDPTLYVPVSADPMASLPNPTVPSGCDYGGNGNQHKISSKTTLDPSKALVKGHLTFCKGLKVDFNTNVTLLPGIYYIKGESFDISGPNTTVQGSNVMIYLTDHPGLGYEGKGLIVGSAGTLDIKGRTGADDPYRGIAIYVDRDLGYHKADVSFESASTLNLSGVIYAPNQVTRIHSGTQGFSSYGGDGLAIVSDVLEVTSSVTGLYVDNDFSWLDGDEPLFKEAVLLE